MMLVKRTRLVMHSGQIMMVGNYQKIFVMLSVQGVEGRGSTKIIQEPHVVFYTLKPSGVFMSVRL